MRIGIVNDMLMVVEAIRRVLAKLPQHEVAWVAHNGADAVESCAKDTPDLILMDLFMPKLDGVEATRRIMKESPCPILVVTSSVATHATKAFEAMGAGALDAVDTPTLGIGKVSKEATELLGKINTIELAPKSEARDSIHSGASQT